LDMDYDALAERARPALIVAAMRRTPVTYGELGRALDLDENLPLSHHINRVLDIVSQRCIAAGEPSLAVIVVNQQTGEPGPGFRAGAVPWYEEARQCYRVWPPA
jgi:hypothetical protein